MKGLVQPHPGQDYRTWQREILSQKGAISGWECIYAVDLVLCPPASERYIVWLYEMFALDMHKLSVDESLCIRRMQTCTIRFLHTRYGFDVNMPLASEHDCCSFVEDRLMYGMIHSTQKEAKDLVWCGAHRPSAMTKECSQIFQRRSRCARTCRALMSRLFCPLGESLPCDLREMLARALWESRVENEWD